MLDAGRIVLQHHVFCNSKVSGLVVLSTLRKDANLRLSIKFLLVAEAITGTKSGMLRTAKNDVTAVRGQQFDNGVLGSHGSTVVVLEISSSTLGAQIPWVSRGCPGDNS
jgi:hypothetical protein